MIYREIEKHLMKRSYLKMRSNTDLIKIYIREGEGGQVDIINIFKYNDMLPEPKFIIKQVKAFEKYFKDQGKSNISIMNIIFTGRDYNIKELMDQGVKFWIVNLVTARLMVYENQPEDCGDGLAATINGELEYMGSEAGYIKKNWHKLEKLWENYYVTILIILANIIVFVACQFTGGTDNGSLIRDGALSYEYIASDHEYYRLLTCIFLHFGFEHIANNMLVLGVVGTRVEAWMGHLRYGLIYFASGIAASVTSVVYHMYVHEPVLSAGASGAIYGIMGAVLIMVAVMRKADFRRLAFVFALLIIGSFGQQVDFAAHIGGLIVGIINTMAFEIRVVGSPIKRKGD